MLNTGLPRSTNLANTIATTAAHVNPQPHSPSIFFLAISINTAFIPSKVHDFPVSITVRFACCHNESLRAASRKS